MKLYSPKTISRLFLLLTSLPAVAQHQPITLHAGDVITKSVTIKKGVYYLDGRDRLLPAITVEGSNITIDFNGSVLCGNKNPEAPDQFKGTGILVKKGS